ncbi:transglycosylase SLT domain-containing protein [uncultured Erythrobacter sp.]|uniref:transglycosylase SLT domain-containing protein n=1 Tax=uncultured Erythrobacter sp. TaxID=263913 RepID=UPI0026161739|nr:transglycosylase SLT domain-containing protein [uncultured Erythrobacter sp.]
MPHSANPPSAIRPVFETVQRDFGQRSIDETGVRTGASRQIPQAASSANGRVTVESAIASAAQQTGIDFDFLIAQAQVESAMDPAARARTSSATGLYQFIETTWLETMQRHGERFGLANVSAHIRTSQSGTPTVDDPKTRTAILNLRNDPQVAALMAAGLAEDNRAHLAPILGRQPDHGELYLAHFLGAGGAGRFLSAMENNPSQNAATMFRRPAAANRAVFYEPGGSPRSLQGVMEFLGGKLERARAKAPVTIPDSSAIAALSPTNVSLGRGLSNSKAPPPYLIADEQVFAPQSPPVITGQNRPTITGAPALNLAQPGTQVSMSNMLRATFDEATGEQSSKATREQIARAYEQLKALGF